VGRGTAEVLGVAGNLRRRSVKNAGRVRHLALEAFEQFAHPVGAERRGHQFLFLRLAGALDLARPVLGLVARRLRLAERAADGVADADQHGCLDDDDNGMHHNPQQVAATGIDRVRQHEVQTQVMRGDQARRGQQHHPVAKAREHRQDGEIVEMHFDLPGMAREQINQDRGLPGERHRQREGDDLHRPPQSPNQQRGHAQHSRGQNRERHVLPQCPGNRRQDRNMGERKRNQRLGDDRLKGLNVGHGRPAFTPNGVRHAARSCGSSTSHAPLAIARAA
jgi:hypothetical protein